MINTGTDMDTGLVPPAASASACRAFRLALGEHGANSVLTLRPGMTGACFGAAGVPPLRDPRRQGMSARQETIDRYRQLRAIAKQHLSGALKHLSQTAIKEAAQRVGLWSRGMLVMDSPDEMDLVFDVAVFDTKSGRSRAMIATPALTHRPRGRMKPSRWTLCNTPGSTSSACSGDTRSPAW